MQSDTILVIATKNKGKSAEIHDLLAPYPVIVKNLSDFGPIPEIEEDGDTFEANAYKKASLTARYLGYPTLADDSGLCVEALKGAPGVYSARYAGKTATDHDRCQKLLQAMATETNRKAAFECVISIAVPTGAALTYDGRCEGLINNEPVGENGFGYDPLFFFPPLNHTFAELTIAEKSTVSHRGKALHEMVSEFDNVLKWIHQQMPTMERVECQR